jgi:hypothetical protein
MEQLANCPASLKSREEDTQDESGNLGLMERTSRIARDVTVPVAHGAR